MSICVSISVCLLSADLLLCDCSGAGGGQAKALIGRQSLCNLCQITAITRLLLLSALMTPLHKESGSSSNPHTLSLTQSPTRTHIHSEVRLGRSGGGAGGRGTGRGGPLADGRRLKQTGDECMQGNLFTFAHVTLIHHGCRFCCPVCFEIN